MCPNLLQTHSHSWKNNIIGRFSHREHGQTQTTFADATERVTHQFHLTRFKDKRRRMYTNTGRFCGRQTNNPVSQSQSVSLSVSPSLAPSPSPLPFFSSTDSSLSPGYTLQVARHRTLFPQTPLATNTCVATHVFSRHGPRRVERSSRDSIDHAPR